MLLLRKHLEVWKTNDLAQLLHFTGGQTEAQRETSDQGSWQGGVKLLVCWVCLSAVSGLMQLSAHVAGIPLFRLGP